MKERSSRLDIQVFILTAVIVVVCSMSVYITHYHMTYNDMIKSLEERAYSIYEYVDSTLDKSTFYGIDSIEEQESSDAYEKAQEFLKGIKSATGVRYLYTAKRIDTGEFVYIVDGLDENAGDFRNAGDVIEPEISHDMQKALMGDVVLPRSIRTTDWGKIFITYFPIHDNGMVTGVLGIEFEAEHQYETYRNLRVLTPLIILTACILSAAIAVLAFRRISNPTYRDFANTDQLTKLKNRNAYDIDFANMMAQGKHTGVVLLVVDLNNLKMVNDKRGHQCGDEYIRAAANSLSFAATKREIVYRIGGDEFVVVFRNVTENYVKRYMKTVQENFEENKPTVSIEMSLAMGYAFYRREDGDLSVTYSRADRSMYQNKRKYYEIS